MKSVIVDFRRYDVIDHWWTDFCVACGGSNNYEKKLEEYNIKVREIETDVVEVTFPSENDYLLFRLRFP